MRLKTMTLLAVSGLMAASLAYVIPAFAEDAGDIDGEAPMQLAMGDDAGSAANDGGAAATSGAATGTDNSGTPNNPGPSSSNTTSTDQQQGTPDVASGDDDY